MADHSTQIQAQQEDMEAAKPAIVENNHPSYSFDNLAEEFLSSFGYAQLFQTFLVGFATFFDSQQMFITVFTDANPKWHCVDHSICNPTVSDICQLPRTAWDWDKAASKLVISDFGIECSSSVIKVLPSSAFFIGALVGGFVLVMIPDSFLGRKQLLFFSCLLSMSLTGIGISLSPSIWIYSLFKFMIGFSRSLSGTYVIVLISEGIGTKWRPRANMVAFTLFVLGFISLSGVAYVTRNSSWRVLYLCVSVPGILYSILLYLFALESPRWLYLQGRREEALLVLEKTGNVDKTSLESFFSRFPVRQETNVSEAKYSIKELFVRKWALRRILAVMVIAFGVGMSYYGVPLAVRDLNVNIYIGEAVNGLIELPSFVLSPFLLERFNRRSSLLTVSITGGLSGIFCFIVSIVGGGGIKFGFELICFFCARMGYNLMMVYTVELFPTCVRNSATTMVRQALAISGVFCPIMVSLVRSIPSLSFGVFGAALFLFGFSILCLPETKGSTLCDTMEEQEQREPK